MPTPLPPSLITSALSLSRTSATMDDTEDIEDDAPPPVRQMSAISKHTRRPLLPPAHPDLITEHNFHCKDFEQRYKYDLIFQQRKLVPTKFTCQQTLNDLGIFSDFKYFCTNSGLWKFANISHKSYVECTVEFFSSVKLNQDNNNEPVLEFRLLSRDHCLSLHEIRRIFYLPSGAASPPPSFSKKEFWHNITGRTYTNSGMAKASLVFHPIFRYFSRVMAYIVFMRGDMSQVVRETELWLIWSMVTPPHNDDRESHYPDLARIMMKGLADIGQADEGTISAGGLVTRIASYYGYGFHLAKFTEIEGEHTLNIRALQKMAIIKREANRYYYCHPDILPRSFFLPDPARTSVLNHRNWRPSGCDAQDEPH